MGTSPASNRPNILILMTDQQRGDCLSCAGHPVVQTPNLDRLAAEGVRFSNAYTTSPVCMPARSSFLSGLYVHNYGQWNNYGHLPEDVDTYLHHLRAAGYRTCHVGKSHFFQHLPGEDMRDYDPFMRKLGWDDIFETGGPWGSVEATSIASDHWKKLGVWEDLLADYEKRRHKAGGHLKGTWPSVLPEGETLDDFVARTAADYVSSYESPEPLLLFVGFGSPHEPWDPPRSWADRYDPAAMPPPEPAPDPGPWVPQRAADYQRKLWSQFETAGEDLALIRSRYFAKISHADECAGRVLEAFDQRGWMENTAVIFWSDHGEMLGDKQRLHKGVFFEPSARVPLIVRRPRETAPGTVAPGLVDLTDLFPTILELGGCPPKETAFGRSLLPMCADPSRRLREAVFSEVGDRTMVRDERYQLVVNAQGDSLLLFDMARDPGEEVNILGKPEAAAVEAGLRARLLSWHLKTPTDQRQYRAGFKSPSPPKTD